MSVFNISFTASVTLDLCIEWGDRHGDLCRLPASQLSAEAGRAAVGGGCLLLPHPPGLPHTHTPRYGPQVSGSSGCRHTTDISLHSVQCPSC